MRVELIGADSPEPMERQIVSELSLRRKVARSPAEIFDLGQGTEISLRLAKKPLSTVRCGKTDKKGGLGVEAVHR
jgi:hypothetical protein